MDKKRHINCPVCGHDVFQLMRKTIEIVHVYETTKYIYNYDEIAQVDEEAELLCCNQCNTELDINCKS